MSLSYKISTITMCVETNIEGLNLINIGKYLKTDDIVIGLKYNFNNESVLKGEYLTTFYKKSKLKNIDKVNKNLFYNQISIIINYNNHNVNVKLFGNGNLQFTGIKDISEGKDISKIIYDKIKKIKGYKENILLTKDENGVFLDIKNIIYSTLEIPSIIGFKNRNNNILTATYNIDKKYYTIEQNTDFFTCTKFEGKRIRQLLDFNGDNIGYSQIQLVKNKGKLYSKNTNVHTYNNTIYYDGKDNSYIIGKINYYFKNSKNDSSGIEKNEFIKNENVCNKVVREIKYYCNPFKNDICEFTGDDVDFKENVNCINIVINLGFELNRQRMYIKFVENNYLCKYKPETYSGVKFFYKYNTDNNGKCICNNKCTCINITFFIFQSGNVIGCGFKSIEQIEKVLLVFKNITDEFKKIVEKKLITSFY